MIIWSKDHLMSAEWWSDQFYANYEAHGPVRWLIQGLGLVNLYQTEKVLFQSECMHLILKVTSFGFRQSSCGLERSRVDGDLELRRPSGSLQSDLDRLNVCVNLLQRVSLWTETNILGVKSVWCLWLRGRMADSLGPLKLCGCPDEDKGEALGTSAAWLSFSAWQ